MRALVLSDSHGMGSGMQRMLAQIWAAHSEPIDFYLYCGDGIGDFLQAKRAIAEKNPNAQCLVVRGNCDWGEASVEDTEILFRLGGKQAMLCHGHHYGVKRGLGMLDETAYAQGCALTFYGHTHEPNVEAGRTLMVNPGSALLGCYALVDIVGEKISANLYRLS